jgi:uncharacterized protein (TIGR02594 family)
MSLYSVTADTLNVRKSPSADSKNEGTLKQGELLWGNQKSEDGNWLEINFRDMPKKWVSAKYVTAIAEEYPNWIEIAAKELHIRELPNDPDNPRIVEYLKSTTLGIPDNDQDETPWCSAFVNWCMEQVNLKGTNSAQARSWLTWGKKLEQPKLGCIVVFSRPPNPSHGHVSFYVGETPKHIQVFGGNQDDEVNIKSYEKSRLLEYRWSS